ncbi:hypothetical protein FBZ96_106607 [Bradyrhizobium stylosanthis]|uniref:Uncharacterized protein n=1 Tax=Bradyrhizobium stylosanthis TaxID=1803665 RepID=A0A560DKB8_9BRAD|nr:hypothetical protein FBZ96_106607 [Bradyrhizobium stylosanthis]
MQNPILYSQSEKFIRDFQRDHENAIQLEGVDVLDVDYIETPLR